ncbi:hypothetical protein TSOC_004218 [Tetrabaena socialis]|uniref:Uncharacterized protein n=1 Tax=Tetrabaena socialis TaxID=47790 RepID=A0A2J8A9H8_9CHLO|nr:hypothetical protein TSOC_004218 [Tetrabaena socialis]|eukprot:PNH09161.1 hypothetical protein TSOC_004218 [Tetrabaena socialis]
MDGQWCPLNTKGQANFYAHQSKDLYNPCTELHSSIYNYKSLHAGLVTNWDSRKLRFKPNQYPQPLEASLPRMFFVSLFVGSRGSGKTFSLVKLLKNYERAGIVDPDTKARLAQRVILFSPTLDANPVFSSLKNFDAEHDSVHSYSDGRLLEVLDDIKREREETLEYQRKLKLYLRFRRMKDVRTLGYEELIELEKTDYKPPKEPKYPQGVVTFLVLDDLVGSAAFKSTGRSALTNLVLKNRHLGVNILIATQNLKAIPKSIRTNTSLFVIFRFASKKINCDDLYEEVSNLLTLEKFEEVFDHATKEAHDYLVIDFSQPKDNRLKKNFDRVLQNAVMGDWRDGLHFIDLPEFLPQKSEYQVAVESFHCSNPIGAPYSIECGTVPQGNSYSTMTKGMSMTLLNSSGNTFARSIHADLIGCKVQDPTLLRGSLHNIRFRGMDGDLVAVDAFGVTPLWRLTLVVYPIPA